MSVKVGVKKRQGWWRKGSVLYFDLFTSEHGE